MEPAAALHHSRDGGRVTHYVLRAPKTASTAAGAQYFCFGDDEVLAAGDRPAPLAEVRPQGRLERHIGGDCRTIFTRTSLATCGCAWILASESCSAPTSTGTSRGGGDLGSSSCFTSTGA